MTDDEPTIYIIDDDVTARKSLSAIVETLGVGCETFGSGDEFLQAELTDRAGVLLISLQLSDISGPELQQQLTERGSLLPVIFLSNSADVPTTVRVMQNGAFTLLQKPYQKADLLEAVRRAIRRNAVSRQKAQEFKHLCECLAALSSEEQHIMQLMIEGKPNKIIARELNASMRTVDRRRRSVLDKMNAGSIAELVQKVAEHRYFQSLFSKSSDDTALVS